MADAEPQVLPGATPGGPLLLLGVAYSLFRRDLRAVSS
jgi:hypothetical protein